MDSYANLLLAHLRQDTSALVRFIDRESTGTCWRHFFEVMHEDRSLAARALLRTLHDNRVLWIHDHRFGDSEGALIFDLQDGVLHARQGGHGHAGKANPISHDEALALIQATLQATQWGPPLGSGWIETPQVTP